MNDIFRKLVPGLRAIYGNLLVSIILYGSAARGTQTPESDVDIAVILKEGATKKMYDQQLDLVVDLQLEYDIILSIVRLDFTQFTEWENVLPYYKNVKKDGVTLWPVA